MLAVAVGLVKGLGEVVGHQQGEVGVLAAQAGVGVAVAVHRVDALHILRHHVAVGVHAEGAHLVPVPLGAVDELGLVDHVGDGLEDQGGQLHPHADVDLVVGHGQAQGAALVGEPLRPGPAGGGDEEGGGVFVPAGGLQAVARPIPADGGDGGVKLEGDVLPQVLVEVGEDAQVVLRAQVLYPGLEEVEVVLQRLPPQGLGLRGGGGKDLGGGPVGHVDLVHIVDEVHDLPLRHEVGEPAAEGGGEVIFPVREGPCPAKTAHGVADLAVYAGGGLACHDGAAAVVDVPPLVHHQHPQAGAAAAEFVGGEDAGLAAA